MRNESGVVQVWYQGSIKRSAARGAEVPEEHLTEQARRILSAPRPGTPPARPGTRIGVVELSAAGSPVRVDVPRPSASAAELLRAAPSILLRAAGELPGPLSAAATTEPRSAARWEVSDPSAPVPLLAAAARAALRGEPLDGAPLLLRGRPPASSPGRVLVVLCACDAPRWEARAAEGVLSDPDAPEMDLRVVDDASSAPAARAVLEALGAAGRGLPEPDAWTDLPEAAARLPAGSTARYLRRSARRGYLENANEGARDFGPDHGSIVFLNGDTDPGRGWLRALLRALARDRVGFVNPMTDNNVDLSVPVPPGCSASEASDLALLLHDGSYPDAFCPSGFCLAVRGEVWRRYGPWDGKLWGTGYGEETDVELLALRDGWRGALAPDAFVRHARSRSFGDAHRDEAVRKAAALIRKRHPDFDGQARAAARGDSTRSARLRLSAARRSPPEAPGAAFLMRSFRLSGGALAAFLASDALRRLGRDSVVVGCGGDDLDMYDSDAAPLAFRDDADLARAFRAEVLRAGWVVSASVSTFGLGETLRAQGPGVRHCVYAQDDERLFRRRASNQELVREAEAAWRDADLLLAVSAWVADAAAEVRGSRPEVLPASYDPLVWYPRPDLRRPGGPLRVAALYRPETPHRGGDLLLEAMHASGAGVEFHVIGGRLPGGAPRHVHLGRLPHHRLAPAVAACDVYLDCSPFQGFGLNALEALASGAGLVCLENGGCREYASPACAEILPAGSSGRDVAEALRALSADRDRAASLGAAGPSAAAPFASPAVGALWERALFGDHR